MVGLDVQALALQEAMTCLEAVFETASFDAAEELQTARMWASAMLEAGQTTSVVVEAVKRWVEDFARDQ